MPQQPERSTIGPARNTSRDDGLPRVSDGLPRVSDGLPRVSARLSSVRDGLLRVSDVLLRVSDGGLLGMIFVAPFFMGGRHPMGRLVFVLCAVVLAGAWFLRQCFLNEGRWRSTAAQWLLLAAVSLLVVQLVPLPMSFVAHLASHVDANLPLWTTHHAPLTTHLGDWSQVSVSPAETRAGLAILLAYGLTFLVAVQRLERIEDVERTLAWLAAAAVVMGLFGLVQFFTSNGKFVWVYEHPFRSVCRVQGSFINKNHFAHLLALGIGPLVCCLLKKLREQRGPRSGGFHAAADDDRQRHFTCLAIIIGISIVLFAALMSLSRGGALAIATAMVVAGAIYCLSHLLDKRLFLGLVGVAVLLGAFLAIHGYSQVSQRLDDFTALSVDELDQTGLRRQVWAATWQAFLTNPWLGQGVGTHCETYKIFMDNRLPVEYTHAENGYLQVASETGIAGLALLFTGIGICGYWCVACFLYGWSRRLILCLGATAAGLSASLVHSLVDFVWYIPATMSWTVLLAAMACRLYQLSRLPPSTARETELRGPAARGLAAQAATAQESLARGTVPWPRVAWGVAAALVMILGTSLVLNHVGPARASCFWDDYLKRSQQLADMDDTYRNSMSPAQRQELDTSREALVVQIIEDLEQHLRLQPDHARAHLRMATVCLRRFHQQQRYGQNPMNVSQIREAALASNFSSREALYEWLDRAIGAHRPYLDKALWHARRGLQLCPLQGEGYLYLADLCFLQGTPSQAKEEYVQQALLVRPYDGHVLFQAGKEAILAGDLEQAITYWKRSYESGQEQQEQIANLLAGKVPVAFFLESFQPGLRDWKALYAQFAAVSPASELTAFCRYFLTQAEREPEAAVAAETANLWVAMQRVLAGLGDQVGADDCLRRAMLCGTDNYRTRLEIFQLLLSANRFDEAEEQLKWCLQRRPSDKRARSAREALVRAKTYHVRAATVGRPYDSLRRQARVEDGHGQTR